VGRHDGVGGGEGLRERLDGRERPVGGCVHVREVEDRADPAAAARDLDDVLGAPEVADAAHHLDPERHRAVLLLQPCPEFAELLADVVDRLLAREAEQEARVENDYLGARGLGDPSRVVEHPDGHVELLPALRVAHEPGDWRVDGERNPVLAGELAEPSREVVVHPELALEVDLAGGVAALEKQLDRFFGAPPRGNPRRPELDRTHRADGTYSGLDPNRLRRTRRDGGTLLPAAVETPAPGLGVSHAARVRKWCASWSSRSGRDVENRRRAGTFRAGRAVQSRQPWD